MHPFLMSRAMKLLKIWYLRWDIRHLECHISLSISQSSEGHRTKIIVFLMASKVKYSYFEKGCRKICERDNP